MIQISPTAISIPLSEEQIIDTNVFEIESDKKNKIEIKVLKSNINIILEGKQKNSLESTFYCSKQSINEIKNNKYFLMFDNLDEIYEEIINLMRKNKPILLEENNKIIISIPISTTKIKESKFILYKKEKSDKERIDDLYSIFKSLKKNYNNKINKLYRKIKEQNNKINELNNKLENQNKIIMKPIKKEEKLNQTKIIIMKPIKNEEKLNKIDINIFDDSLIINKNDKYISYLNEWLSKDKQNFKTQLLFRKSINGDSYNEFHRLCDNQGKTITLIQTKDGLIIGGYTVKNWDTSGIWYEDDEAFVFSLTKGRIFPIKKNCKAILGSKYNGPWFACFGFHNKKEDKKGLSQGYYYYKNKNDEYFENYDELIPNDKKNTIFDVNEVEIYKIEK